jgi:hypothetical protein
MNRDRLSLSAWALFLWMPLQFQIVLLGNRFVVSLGMNLQIAAREQKDFVKHPR